MRSKHPTFATHFDREHEASGTTRAVAGFNARALILASSPHARRGVLWEVFKRHYGAGGDPLILVAHGASRTLNPSLPHPIAGLARLVSRINGKGDGGGNG